MADPELFEYPIGLRHVNFNNDGSEYWEFSDTGFAPIDLSNEAHKLGVNYVIYAMTH